MKDCWKHALIVIGLGILAGILTSVLFAWGTFFLEPSSFYFPLAVSIGVISLLTLLIGLFICKCNQALSEAYCCCGSVAAAGAAGLTLSALFQSLLLCGTCEGIGILLAGVNAFFWIMLLGGIFCLIRDYAGCHKDPCRPCKDPCDSICGDEQYACPGLCPKSMRK